MTNVPLTTTIVYFVGKESGINNSNNSGNLSLIIYEFKTNDLVLSTAVLQKKTGYLICTLITNFKGNGLNLAN